MQPEKKNKLVLLAGAGAVVGLILFIWFFVGGPGSRVSVEVFAVPSDATITMDGKKITLSSEGRISISKGKHTFKAERQYFGSVTEEINTTDLGKNKTVYLALFPNSPEGEAFLDANPEERMRYERIGGAIFTLVQETVLRKYPVTESLPYETLDYKIDYDISKDRKSIIFLVTLYPPAAVGESGELYKQTLEQYKADALGYLERNGVDTNKEKITFTPDPDNL